MIDGLIGGKIHGKPERRTSKSGNSFVTAKVRAAMGEGESMFVNAITFSDKVGDTLLALDEGDSVSLAGVLTPKVWTNAKGESKPVLDMVVNAAITAYHVQRKRKAVAEDATQPEILEALKMAQAALNTAPMFKVPSLPQEYGNSYKVASAIDAAIARASGNEQQSHRVPAKDGLDNDLPWQQ